MSSRRPQTAGEGQREQLLAAALELLETRGPNRLNVRELAETAGTSTMGLYTHFGSKNGLLEALYVHGSEMLNGALADVPETDDAAEDVFQLARAYRRFALENAALHSIMFERAASEFRPSDETRQAALAAFGVLVARVARWLGAEGAEQTAYLIWGTAHGLLSLELIHVEWDGPVMEHLRGSAGSENFDGSMRRLLVALGRA